MRMFLAGLACLAFATPAAAQLYYDPLTSNALFTTDYAFIANTPNGNTAGGQYTIAPSAFPWNPNFADYGDHTTGTGNYMVVNGSEAVKVYENAVGLALGAGTYTFSFALSDACCNANAFSGVDPSPPLLGFNLGTAPGAGTQQATYALAANTPAGVWQTFSTTFTTGSAGVYYFQIANLNQTLAGNDFGIDDVTISAVPEAGTWAMMILGVGAAGGALRRRRAPKVNFAAA